MQPMRVVAFLLVASASALPCRALAQAAPAPESAAVIPAGASGYFSEVMNPAPRTLAGGWHLEGIRMGWTSVVATFTNARRTAIVEVVHPDVADKPLARTGKFALVAPDRFAAPPPALVKTLAERLKSGESGFAWVQQSWPDAVSVTPASRPGYEVANPEVAARLKAARDALDAGRKEQAAQAAREAAASPLADVGALRSAASILRCAGSAPEAVVILERAMARAAGTPDGLRIRLERIAALEAFGDHESVSRSSREIAAQLPRLYPDPRCVRADVLSILLQEGRVAEAGRAAGFEPDPVVAAPGAPRCVFQYAVRAAAAKGDEALLQARAQEALKAFPDDPVVTALLQARRK